MGNAKDTTIFDSEILLALLANGLGLREYVESENYFCGLCGRSYKIEFNTYVINEGQQLDLNFFKCVCGHEACLVYKLTCLLCHEILDL